ncbi:hypothetical protein Tco_0931966, partial [Tanacetum coccineum]
MTKDSSPKPTEGSEQSHSVSSGTVSDPKDLERNIQLVSMRLPSILDEDTPSNEGTTKTTPRPEGPLGDKDSGETNHPLIWNQSTPLLLILQALPCYSLMMKWFKKVMRRECLRLDEDTQEDTEVHPDLKKFDNILPLTERKPVKYLKRVSRVLFNRLTEAQWVQYEEVVVSYADLEAAIEGYYEENIDHKEQTDKVINAAMNSLDKNGIAMGDLLNALNGVTEALKAIQDTVKEEHVLNKKVLEHLASWYKSSTSMAWNLVPRMTAIESSQAEIRSEISSLKKDTSNIKSMMQRYISPLKADTKEPPSHTEGEHAAMEEEPTNAIIIDDQPEDQRNLVHASKEARLDPDAPILVPYEINGKNFQLTDEQIQAYLDKEKKIKKDSKEAKMFEMTKTEVIKVVQEEAKKIGLDPKKIISAKAGEKFKKAQDVEHQ